MRSTPRTLASALAAMVGMAGAGTALAEEAFDEQPAVASSSEPPRLIRTDLPIAAERSLPGYRSEVTEMSYRWWASSGRAHVGLGLGTLTYLDRPTGTVPGLATDASSIAIAGGTMLTMGLRYRTSATSAVFADASGVRGRGLDGGDAVVSKVGFEFGSTQSRWNVTYGGLGFRLAGDTRMTLRVRRGGLSIYMRSSF